MKYLFTMWDGGGNVAPELAIARKLVARGHTVRVLADPTMDVEVRAAGCTLSPWTTAPHRTTRDKSGDVFRDYEHKNPMAMLDAYMREFLAEPAPRWVGDTLRELEASPADALVTDFGIPSTLIAAEKLGMPSAVLYPNIWMIPTPGIPPVGPGFLPARGPLGRLRDAAMRMLTTRMFDKAVPALNAVRAAHGLAAIEHTHEQLLRTDRIIVLTSPRFDFTSPSMPKHVRYTGPELDDPQWSEQTWRAPWPDDDPRPLVVVGLSSTFQDQSALLGRIVEALGGLPVRALVTLGLAITHDEVPRADNVTIVASAPHSVVLREASLLLTHCGHGTTMKGLRAGVPLVCIPMGRDQNDTAARVEHGGAGVRLKPTASVAAIREAVTKVLATPEYARGARRFAQAIANREGCLDAIDELEGLMRERRAVA